MQKIIVLFSFSTGKRRFCTSSSNPRRKRRNSETSRGKWSWCRHSKCKLFPRKRKQQQPYVNRSCLLFKRLLFFEKKTTVQRRKGVSHFYGLSSSHSFYCEAPHREGLNALHARTSHQNVRLDALHACTSRQNVRLSNFRNLPLSSRKWRQSLRREFQNC